MPVHQRYSNFEADQRKFFDELITEDWDTYSSKEWDFTRTFEIEKLFERIKPSNILDIGCGVGFHDLLMADYPFVSNVDAIDYSEQSVHRANLTYPHPKVNRFVADIGTFIPECKYDLAISFQVFEHLSNPDDYWKLCLKAVKPGGIVAICTPNRLRWDNLIFSLQRKPLQLIDIMHYKEYTVNEIFSLGRSFQLKPAGWFGHTWYPSNLFSIRRIRELPYQKRTKLGYFFPRFANIICVLMKKENIVEHVHQ